MDFKVLFSQLAVLYEKLTKQQKMIIATAVIGIVAFLIFMIVYVTQKNSNNYEILFNSLSYEDAAKVVDQLEKDAIPYKLENNNIIKVPRDVVYKERITIASMGIPKNNNVGFEPFDTQKFAATSFDQNVKYLRTLESELSRTINALAPIESASVSLAIAKDTLFVAKQIDPSASVMVELVEGRRLSSKQIRGIKNLVSAAVPKLTSNNVMIIDSEGETLGDEDEMAQMGELSVAQQKFKNKEERKRQRKIIEVISPFVGGNEKVVAQVTIDFDFSIKSSTSEVYDPKNVVRSEQISQEKREGTTNYEVGKTVSTTKSQFARIKRISAAVIVDGKYNYKLDQNGKPTSELQYEALQESDLDALTSLVSRSIGIDEKRGDEISIKNLQFKRNNSNAEPDGISKALSFSQTYLEPFAEFFKYLFVLILLFILYKKVISPFAFKMLEISKEDKELERPLLNINENEEDLIEKVQQMRKKVESQLGVSDGLDEDKLKYDILLEKVRNMALEEPEEIANLLESLLVKQEETFAKKERFRK